MAQIEKIFRKLHFAATTGNVPEILIQTQSKSKGRRQRKLRFWSKQAPQFGMSAVYEYHIIYFIARFVRVLQIIHDLLKCKIFATKRDIFYRDVGLFGRQSIADKVIDAIALHFNVSRYDLNIVCFKISYDNFIL